MKLPCTCTRIALAAVPALLAAGACAPSASVATAELPLTVVVPAAGSAIFGGPAAALTLAQLRAVITTATAAPGNFQCARTDCLPIAAPANSLLVVLTPSPAACDPVTALHARLTSAHTLTITADVSIDCVGGAAAQSAAALIAIPLSALPPGSLTVVAPGPRAVPASTQVVVRSP